MRLLDILRQEHSIKTISSMAFSGMPSVVAYHISDYLGFIIQALMDGFYDEEEEEYSSHELWLKHTIQAL